MFTHVNITGSEADKYTTGKLSCMTLARRFYSGLYQAVNLSWYSVLSSSVLMSTKQPHPRLAVFAVLSSLLTLQNRSHKHKQRLKSTKVQYVCLSLKTHRHMSLSVQYVWLHLMSTVTSYNLITRRPARLFHTETQLLFEFFTFQVHYRNFMYMSFLCWLVIISSSIENTSFINGESQQYGLHSTAALRDLSTVQFSLGLYMPRFFLQLF